MRLFLALAGVVLLAVTALSVIWLAGQLLTGVGWFIVGLAGVLLRLFCFLLVAGGLGGVTYFVTSAWQRPAAPLTVAGPRAPATTANKTGVNGAGIGGTDEHQGGGEPIRPIQPSPEPTISGGGAGSSP